MTPNRLVQPDGTDMGPTELNERSTISVPLMLTLGGVVVGGILWANSLNVAVAEVKRDQENDRRTIQRIEASVDRVEQKVDAIRAAVR